MKRQTIRPVLIHSALRMVPLYEGTRWYVHRGRMPFCVWIDALLMNGIQFLPLQIVPDYVGVRREAVFKRAMSGDLTVLRFCFPDDTRTTKKNVDLVPKAECDQYRDLITSRKDSIPCKTTEL